MTTVGIVGLLTDRLVITVSKEYACDSSSSSAALSLVASIELLLLLERLTVNMCPMQI